MFGLGGEEIIFIVILVLLVVGPERLPEYVRRVTDFAKAARRYVNETKEKVSEELGPEFSDVDWQKLDPRQYDPRKIVRDALLEDTVLDPNLASKKAAATARGVVAGAASVGGAAVAEGSAGADAQAVGNASDPRTQSQHGSERMLGFDTYQPLASGTAAPFDPEAT